MPVRLVRPWCDSDRVDTLGDAAEVFFLRLIMCADDYGRFSADPRLLKAALYPLRDIRNADIARLLQRCEHSGLIAVYNGADGKPYAAIRNFGQRMRAKTSKYPAPPEKQMTDTCQTHDGHLLALDGDGDGDGKRDNCAGAHISKKNDGIAAAAEIIASLYPREKVGIFRDVVTAVINAILRETDLPGRDIEKAISIVRSGTLAYAAAVKEWTDKGFITDAVKFFDTGMYNHSPETFQRQRPEQNENRKTRVNPLDKSTWKR